jgi:hypothetical protein
VDLRYVLFFAKRLKSYRSRIRNIVLGPARGLESLDKLAWELSCYPAIPAIAISNCTACCKTIMFTPEALQQFCHRTPRSVSFCKCQYEVEPRMHVSILHRASFRHEAHPNPPGLVMSTARAHPKRGHYYVDDNLEGSKPVA